MSATVDAGYVWLAVVMGLNSAIAAYYYLKLIVFMFLKEPTEAVSKNVTYYNVSKPLMAIVGFAVILTVLSIFMVNPLIEYISTMIQASSFGI
jgi:NADH-quinone oxidoreductase subunit N